jgi:hypothetical protein
VSENPVDDGLRGRFRELRAETERAGAAPGFRGVIARAEALTETRPALEVIAGGAVSPRSRRRFVRVGTWASAALAATVAGLLLVDSGPNEEEEFARLVAAYSSDISGGAWRSPTSGLLEVPGIDMVRSVPSIETSVPTVAPNIGPESVPTPGPREDA